MSHIESMNLLYRQALKESNDWLIANEGVDLCYHIDDATTKALVKRLIDDIYSKEVIIPR